MERKEEWEETRRQGEGREGGLGGEQEKGPGRN